MLKNQDHFPLPYFQNGANDWELKQLRKKMLAYFCYINLEILMMTNYRNIHQKSKYQTRKLSTISLTSDR